MTFTYTIADLNAGTTQTVSAENDAAALREVATILIDMCDHSRDVERITATIDEGVIYTAEGQQPIFLEFEPAKFWARVAAVMTTDAVDYFHGDRAPWQDEEA